MSVKVRSFAKINLGLSIGALRADGFHELRTIYQTLALYDTIRLSVVQGSGIEIHCPDRRVPLDQTNTCYQMAMRVMDTFRARGRVILDIEKRLPVQGGLGGASSNAVSTLLALERAFDRKLPPAEKLRLAAEIGSDLPLFLVGGTTLGVGRGEEVYPLPDLPRTACVLALPRVAVSTLQAFSDWDRRQQGKRYRRDPQRPRSARAPAQKTTIGKRNRKLTPPNRSDKIKEFGHAVSWWLSGLSWNSGRPSSGVPAEGRGRAETPLLDLVRTGIENDFEEVVFSQHPELRKVKRELARAGAFYASLSGSGSTLYGLFRTCSAAERAAAWLANQVGIPAVATVTLSRDEYWKRIFD